MRSEPPYATLEALAGQIGEAGKRLGEIDASEGAAGNISVYVGWDVDPTPLFPIQESFALPTAAPELVGKGFLVTGSGRRLREIHDNPGANLGFVRVEEGGRTGTLFSSPARLFDKLTTEFNSHLALHRDHVTRGDLNFHAIIHAQPVHLVYLSHIVRYQDTGYLNRHILRWQPECIVNLPDGVAFVPFMLPGSPELMLSTVRAMREHQVVLWAKHGVIVRSDVSVKRICDLIEYVQTGARYECINLTNHGLADGLTLHEMRMICDGFGVTQNIF